MPSPLKTWISRALALLLAVAAQAATAQQTPLQQPVEVSCGRSLFAFARHVIPSAHMEPTLWTGRCYSFEKPETGWNRGDIITYRRNGIVYVTRLIAFAGETVQMEGGTLNLNGTPVQTTVFVGQTTGCPEGSDCSGTWMIETLPGGATYLIQDLGETRADSTDVFTVPPDHVFILSDNRDNSLDSRFLAPLGPGFIRADELKRRARLSE